MDSIKGTMTEIYNDLSKSTSGNTIAEVNVSLIALDHTLQELVMNLFCCSIDSTAEDRD